jgi:hypothetical protein
MRNILFFGLCLLWCLSCKQPASKEPSGAAVETQGDTLACYAIKDNIIRVDFDKPVTPSVFDYFESVELIPLDNREEAIIGKLRKLIHYKDKYYALDMQQHIVHVFDKNGKFIFKIDRRGQGPGEYPFLDDIYINPYTGFLELLCAVGFIYDCDLNGNFVKMYRVTDSRLRAVHGMIALNEYITVFYAAFESNKIFYYDMRKKKIIHEEFEEEGALGSFMRYSFYKYKDCWHFYRPFDNRVFAAGENCLEEAYTWDFGPYNRKGIVLSQAARQNNPLLIDEVNARFPCRIFTLGQNGKYVISQIVFRGNLANLIYDKTVQRCSYIPEFSESVGLYPVTVTDEYVLSYCNPGELEQYVTGDMLDEPNRKRYNELIHSMESNPVIIKYHFR